MTYDEFRTGMTYDDVWRMLWVDSDDRTKWVRKSKGVVLRLFRDLKQAMWDEMIARGLDPETMPPPPRPKRIAKPRPPHARRPRAAAPPAPYVPTWQRRKRNHPVGRWAPVAPYTTHVQTGM